MLMILATGHWQTLQVYIGVSYSLPLKETLVSYIKSLPGSGPSSALLTVRIVVVLRWLRLMSAPSRYVPVGPKPLPLRAVTTKLRPNLDHQPAKLPKLA